jgi:hypothetical protein
VPGEHGSRPLRQHRRDLQKGCFALESSHILILYPLFAFHSIIAKREYRVVAAAILLDTAGADAGRLL